MLLGKVYKILYKPNEFYGTGVPIIRINDFDNDGKFVRDKFNRVTVTPDELARFAVEKDDILINRVNSLSHLGKCALVSELSEPTVFESNMMRVRVNKKVINPNFAVRYFVTSDNKKRIRSRARRAVAQSSINQGDVKSLFLPLPLIDEQQEIETALSGLDKRIDFLTKEIELLDELFRAMLEELMTGKLSTQPLIE